MTHNKVLYVLYSTLLHTDLHVHISFITEEEIQTKRKYAMRTSLYVFLD